MIELSDTLEDQVDKFLELFERLVIVEEQKLQQEVQKKLQQQLYKREDEWQIRAEELGMP